MRAAVWHGRLDVRIEDVPEPPSPRPNELKIRVEWCGICGTDLEEYQNGPLYIPVGHPDPLTGRQAPIVIGHEFVGTVVEVGDAASGFEVGDRIAPDTLLFCGECWHCRRHLVNQCEKLAILGLMTDGGCAEYATLPTYMCFKLPAGLSLEAGALAEPTAVAVRAVRSAGISFGDTVVIVGGGTIGLLCLQIAKLSGASQVLVIEPIERRRGIARALGADAAIDPLADDPVEAIFEWTTHGAETAIECSGSEQAFGLLPRIVRPHGTAVVVGLHDRPVPINLFPLVCKEITLRGAFSHIYDTDFEVAVELLGQGTIKTEPLITSKIAIDELVMDGFERLLKNGADQLKILVSPGSRTGDEFA